MRLTADEKAHENRLRRKAERHGLVLQRNPARAYDAPGYGLWRLATVSTRGKLHPVTAWLSLREMADELKALES